jgi:hypothetical protein
MKHIVQDCCNMRMTNHFKINSVLQDLTNINEIQTIIVKLYIIFKSHLPFANTISSPYTPR